jgi:hypothetical protein
LVPSKIRALGIDFSPTDQRALVRTLAAIIGYFIVAFLSYAVNDIVAWRTSFYDASAAGMKERTWLTDEERAELDRWQAAFYDDTLRLRRRWARMASGVSMARVVVDFLLPLGVAAVAILALLSQ